MQIRTSETHPIEVGWVSAGGARVGLTFAPGKHAESWIGGGHWARDLAADLDRLAQHHRAQVLACLIEDKELVSLQIPALVAEAERRGVEVRRFPIVDGGLPDDAAKFAAYVRSLADVARAGRTVVVHCRGGLGRTGLVAGCMLVELGLSPPDALAAVQDARGPKCPENAAQQAFILGYAPRRAHPAHAGAVLGAAIGDAMGNPTEFLSTLAAIRGKYGPRGVQGFELYWERGGRRFAPYTDDTQMAEAVLRALVDDPGADLDTVMTDMARRFVAWSHDPQDGHRAPGNACLAGCAALARGVPWREAGGERAGGCGSVMRAYPFGLVFAGDPMKAEAWAVEHSRLTHRDPIALAACAAMALGVAACVRRESPEATVQQMIASARRLSPATADMMRQARDEARDGVGPEVTLDRLRGWAAHEAIAAAVYIFARHPDDARAAILEGANTPGDSDSIATLAGALVGARVGIDGLPAEWVRDVERAEELRALAARIPPPG